MKCPNCKDTDLLISERKNVEIDFCPSCRGVWLDKGELDKIIELSIEDTSKANNNISYKGSEIRYDREHEDKYYKKKKRESFLSELFDF
jgi:hypothetical protein